MPDESEECPKSPKRSENSSQQSQEPRKLSPSPSPQRSKSPKSSDGEDNSRPQEEKEKEVDGNQKSLSEQIQPYNFSEAQEEALAEWVKDNKLLYDMKDKQYKDKALRRHLWGRKAMEYGVDVRWRPIAR